MNYFSGTFDAKVDGKSRTSIPASFRSILSSASPMEDTSPIVCLYASPNFPAIEAVSPELMDKLEAAIKSMSFWSEKRAQLESAVLAPCRHIRLEPDGRFVLPKELREIAGIEDKVTFLGKGSRFEIWSPAKAAELLVDSRRGLQENGGLEGLTGLEGL
jgi:MraZ protein